MKFPESWIREWVDPRLQANELAERLTMAGHEVKQIETEGGGLQGVVVAEVLEASRHPNADRLTVCRVAAGNGTVVEVVCGAPNVTAGMKSPLAMPGTTLPNGFKLRRSKIRGVESNGMLCSARELKLGDDADGIVRLPDDAPTGTGLGDYLHLPDRILDVDLTPNRGDCFSVFGLARDIAALTGTNLKSADVAAVTAAIDDVCPVAIADARVCPRFAGRVVRGIDAGAKSPIWMTERLRRSGIRAIHPVVDVTNYVMLELGQPLHAYDLDRVRGAIRPRFANAGEKVTLLDEREVRVAEDTIVISDDSGVIGLAGIMGGLGTAVTDATADVFFEAAFWPPALMAGRARSHAMHTDASLRFERGVDPAGQARAIERASELLLGIAGGKAGPLTDISFAEELPARAVIPLRRSRLRAVLGTSLEPDTVASVLQSLQLSVAETAEGWSVTAPSFRFDLSIEDDLIEEVARVFGYERIPEATATAAVPLGPLTERHIDSERVADTLVARDYQEVITYSFIDAETNRRFTGRDSELVLSNPISSEMSVMRGSLWPGMLQAAASNVARQQDRVRLFEIGKSFHGTLAATVEVVRVAALALGPAVPEQWASEPRDADFFDIKSDIEALLGMTGAAGEIAFEEAEHPALQPGQTANIVRNGEPVGVAGKLHPAAAQSLDIHRDVLLFELDAARAFAASVPVARGISKFPAIRRDMALVVAEKVSVAELIQVALAAAPDIIRRAVVFDVYRGPGIEAGRKSVALGLILQETSRTLTDEDADSAMHAAVRRLQHEFAAVLRE